MKYDFSGYATKANLKCSDGRTIKPSAFSDQDGEQVPLVWQHQRNEPGNVLGHAVLEKRADGVYAYCSFNNTDSANDAKEAVAHGDINALSIYANKLVQKGGAVLHGAIKEVSLVIAGANPGAFIDNVQLQHGDDVTTLDDEAVIYTGLSIEHEDQKKEDTVPDKNQNGGDSEETLEDIIKTFNEKQKQALYYLVGAAKEDSSDSDDSDEDQDQTEHSDDSDEDRIEHSKKGNDVSRNVFENKKENDNAVLEHSQVAEIIGDALRVGSLKESVLAHAEAGEYGITDINVLFPDAKTLEDSPKFIKRRTEWVAGVLNGTKHIPFSRVKSIFADITADDARAKGYTKGNLKKEEVFSLLKRTTSATTIYKKQKLDRDDIIDITSFDVVTWIKAEIRLQLEEEIARAILVGDGREVTDEDKIKDPTGSNTDGLGVRSIYNDSAFYAPRVLVDADAKPSEVIDSVLRAQADYEGSGGATYYTTSDHVIDLLLDKDSLGRRYYSTKQELAAALGVSNIVEVPVLKGVSRVDGTTTKNLKGIIVNLSDYVVGADKGGETTFFDDFDIDYNQFKYLYETRISGALTLPKSAIIVEQAVAAAGGQG